MLDRNVSSAYVTPPPPFHPSLTQTLVRRWSLIFHWILAITNSCNLLRYVTRFPCDIFGFYVAFIYLQKGIQVLERLGSGEAFYLSIVAALLVFMVAYICGMLGESSLFTHVVRVFLKDYGTPLTLIFFTGFVYIGRMKPVHLETLPTTKAFMPTSREDWIVDPRQVSVGEVFIAMPFGILLTILFWFDHNGEFPWILPPSPYPNLQVNPADTKSQVSSLIAQGTEFPLRKPAGFHWDLFLLGLTTGVAGILGLPFPNGLIPQAPFHTQSLCVTKAVPELDEKGEHKGGYTFEATHVVEQRLSNLAQGLLTLGTMTGPLLVCLHLIPHGVLAGLFFVMGVQALQANGITAKLVFLARDRSLTPAGHPLLRIRRRLAIWVFVAVELVGFGATFAITQTIAAVGFPVFIMALIPIRTYLLPKWFTAEELDALDAPTASPFTMESCGGIHGRDPYDSETSGATDVTASEGGVFTARSRASDEDKAKGENMREGQGVLGKVRSRGSSKRVDPGEGPSQ